MKCRNWRPENPERPGTSGISGISGISGSLRKRPVRAAPENPETSENPKRKQPRTQIYAFCPKTTGSAPIYLPCHRAFTHEMPHAPALRTAKTHPPRAVNPYPCVSLRNRPKAAPEHPEHPEPPENPENPEPPEPPEHPPPYITKKHTNCNLTPYKSNTKPFYLIKYRELFALFLARFKIMTIPKIS